MQYQNQERAKIFEEKAKALKLSMPAGRPSSYNAEIAERICAEIACSEMSLKQICESDPELPAYRTAFLWLARHEEFVQLYARAKRLQAEVIAEGMLDIADDGTNDWTKRLAYKGPVPDWEVNGENINRSRLRVDIRKWLLAKLLPKKYGDIVENRQADANGEKLQAIRVEFVVPEHTELPDRSKTIELERGSEDQ